MDILYSDFSKAFDRVNHKRLLVKLDRYGLHKNSLAFFHSYLSNRSQYVNFQGQFSQPYNVTSGVPQGSNLGPLLFLLQLDNIKNVIVKSKFSKFADDLRLRKLISSPVDCQDLQDDINNIYAWSLENSLSFNINKCVILTFSRRLNPISWNYTMNNCQLNRVTEIMDLGIFFDEHLDFGSHIINIVDRATKSLGYIRKNSRNFNNPIVLKTLFNSLVTSKMEYGSVVWSPQYAVYNTMLEDVQKDFLRYLLTKISGVNCYRAPYKALLKIFDFEELSDRRIASDVKFITNLLNGRIDDIEGLGRLRFKIPDTRLRSRNQFFDIPKCRTNYHQNSPFNRAMSAYNDFHIRSYPNN